MVFVGAGDIGDCGPGGVATASLLGSIGGIVYTLGDHAYNLGTTEEFRRCYEPTWGRYRARTRPSPGNHDYYTPDAAGYFTYFGRLAGVRGLGYYSFDLGAWHIVSLNSNVPIAPQVSWLRTDLSANSRPCVLAYWHHPKFSSAARGGDPFDVSDFWSVLYEFRADVILNAHDHVYERFAPQNPSGAPDSRGIRQFTVGTGGHGELHPFVAVHPASEIRSRSGWGVLKLTLRQADYQWQFVPVAGNPFTDAGTGACVP